MNQAGDKGAKTVFDVAPALLSPLSGDDIRAHMGSIHNVPAPYILSNKL